MPTRVTQTHPPRETTPTKANDRRTFYGAAVAARIFTTCVPKGIRTWSKQHEHAESAAKAASIENVITPFDSNSTQLTARNQAKLISNLITPAMRAAADEALRTLLALRALELAQN